MMKLDRLWAIGLCLLAGCAGAGDRDEKPEPESIQRPLMGRVASLHLDEGFVLVETFGQWTLTQGTRLLTLGNEGRSATLVISGERMGRYAAADVKAGELAVGDAVMLRTSAGTDGEPEEEPSPSAGDEEDTESEFSSEAN